MLKQSLVQESTIDLINYIVGRVCLGEDGVTDSNKLAFENICDDIKSNLKTHKEKIECDCRVKEIKVELYRLNREYEASV